MKVQKNCIDGHIILVGTKMDKSSDSHDIKMIKDCEYFECSSILNLGVEEIFENAARKEKKHNDNKEKKCCASPRPLQG